MACVSVLGSGVGVRGLRRCEEKVRLITGEDADAADDDAGADPSSVLGHGVLSPVRPG